MSMNSCTEHIYKDRSFDPMIHMVIFGYSVKCLVCVLFSFINKLALIENYSHAVLSVWYILDRVSYINFLIPSSSWGKNCSFSCSVKLYLVNYKHFQAARICLNLSFRGTYHCTMTSYKTIKKKQIWKYNNVNRIMSLCFLTSDVKKKKTNENGFF